jgi:hypothetical protein
MPSLLAVLVSALTAEHQPVSFMLCLADRGLGGEGSRLGLNAPAQVEPMDFDSVPDPDFRSLQSLSAILVLSNFLRHHIKDLVWIKARLMEHQAHIIICRKLAMKNLSSIERALYTEEKFAQLNVRFEGQEDE